MKSLNDIIPKASIIKWLGKKRIKVTGLTLDSRNVESEMLFVALKGSATDGHKYISKAIDLGASVILCEDLPDEIVENITYIQVSSTREYLGEVASNYYGHPSRKLNLIGITGTNGKTTTVNLLYDLFESAGYKCGLISTIENKIHSRRISSTHTTPNAIELNALLSEMVDEGCEIAFMEVSSHAIDQNRIGGLRFAGGIYTNISHEHLDYHGSFKEYIKTKKKFFDNLDSEAFALINKDDRNAEIMVQNCKAKKFGYALKKMTDFKARILDNSISGLHLKIDEIDLHARLIGEYNAYNLLAAYGSAALLGMEKELSLTLLSKIKPAEGRFDSIRNMEKDITGIIDYAHSPDALKNVLNTIRSVKTKKARMITVFGAGGNRDKSKRPQMGAIASSISDVCIITSDNPRDEEPMKIIEEIMEGIQEKSEMLVIPDRAQAIKTAVKIAQKGDIILIAGKGHEKYQEIKNEKIPFDDMKELKACLLKDI